MGNYTSEDSRMLNNRALDVKKDLLEISRSWNTVKLNDVALDFARHGFLRRCLTLSFCIEKIYKICPPQKKQISSEEIEELTVYLQAGIFNTFGALDNLAHVLNEQLNLNIKKEYIGLAPANKSMRKCLDPRFQAKLQEFDNNQWFDYLVDYRHALAHQIPLYVPPYVIPRESLAEYDDLSKQWEQALIERKFDTAEEIEKRREKLGYFDPFFAHSRLKKPKLMLFHSQILQDWGAIKVISELAVEEIKLKTTNLK